MKKVKKLTISLLLLPLFLSACSSNNPIEENSGKELNNGQESQETASSSDVSSEEDDYGTYINEKYDISFDYPPYLEVVSDKESIAMFSSQNRWLMEMNVNNQAETEENYLKPVKILKMEIVESISAQNFSELKAGRKGGFGSTSILEDEQDKTANNIDFFIQTWKTDQGQVNFVIVTLIEPGTEAIVGVIGNYEDKEKVKEEVYKIIESFK